MLVILGSAFDDQPWRLAERWAERDVAVVTPGDLSRPGWRLRRGRPRELRAALANRIIAGDEIDAVVSLLPWVWTHDLPHIVTADREYVANEMAAFLLAWLAELDCPVVERPTPSSLAGCGWWPAEWVALGRRVGVRGDAAWVDGTVEVTVVGGRAVDGDTSTLRMAAEVVAEAAGMSLVTLQFADQDHDDPILVGAAPRPAAGSAAAADALLSWLESR